MVFSVKKFPKFERSAFVEGTAVNRKGFRTGTLDFTMPLELIIIFRLSIQSTLSEDLNADPDPVVSE
jgi:hypothetical protein